MGNIVLLDELTINKIAAGEVIERPASVVKELIENSIDAGADKITVEIENGGIKKIKIIDNGCGISKDDLEFAFERHATSKIRTADDLEKVKSMGFRGEALASIAAISNVKMVSRTENDESGNMIVVEGGKVLESEEIAASVGTTITVTNLFFNTPVRYKFLKKDFTEAGYIEDIVTRIALSHPSISIKLLNGNKTIIQTNGSGSIKDVIYSIYGKDVAEGIIDVSYDYEDVKVEGVIGKPEIARGNRSFQQFFVNNRYIKDKTLTSAAEQAYKGLLTVGKYGFLVLNINIEPSKVDVNVHPTKLEIRWQEEQKIFKAVYHTIREGLLKDDLIKTPEKPEESTSSLFTQTTFTPSVSESINSEKSEVSSGVAEEVKPEEVKEEISLTEEQSSLKTQLLKNSAFMNLFKKKDEEDPEEMFIENSKENAIQDIFNIKNGIEETPVVPKVNEIKEEVEKEKEQKEESEAVEEKVETVPDKTVVMNTIKEEETVEENKEEAETVDEEAAEPIQQESIQDATIIMNTVNEEENVEKQAEEQKEDLEQTQKVPKDDFKVPSEEQIDKIASILNLQKSMDEDIEKREEATEFNSMYEITFGISLNKKAEDENLKAPKADLSKAENVSVFENSETYTKIPPYKFIGALFNTYIVIELKDDIYIIDQHAAHERVMYEEVKKNFYSETEKDSQIMLLPDIINLTHKEKEIVKENVDLFKKAGFIFEEFGENTIRLIGVPSMCMDLDTKELFLQILDEIDTVAITATQEKEEKFMSTVACKAAVKAKMKLDKEEVDDLMKQLLVLKNPFTCPHGRPTAIKMTKGELDRKFERT